MLGLLWLVPILPYAGFLILTLLGRYLPRKVSGVVGTAAVGGSVIVTVLLWISFVSAPPPDNVYVQLLWPWIQVGSFSPEITLHLDSLSLVMISVVTFVGFLIHLYSTQFMIDEERYNRFFAEMNLFVGSMLTLVLADNLLLLFFGWEGVGLCSYLLIGFWYQDPANGRAARKAFIVTRIGDAALAFGLFLLFDNLGTLRIQELMQRATEQWSVGSGIAVAAAALVLGGAIGKSAQVPLQIWLPDAMAGPTPVSALIHAATMVTAGVYLIARTHALFILAPAVQLAVAIIGAVTLLLSGFSGLAQRDIKRVLAYSTISQIGYMFLALGVGAWSAAIFHLMTHACFKALLFLSAGVIILRLEHEHDIYKMGGLRKELPLVFWVFLIGACSLSAVPVITAGFYSKDLILYDAWVSASGSPWLWGAGLLGALLTSFYTFRAFFVAFLREPTPTVKKASPLTRTGAAMGIPLIVLAVLAIVAGVADLPPILGNKPFLTDFLHTALPEVNEVRGSLGLERLLTSISGLVSVIGIAVMYFLFIPFPRLVQRATKTPVGVALHQLWQAGWGFDWLDNEFIVRPFVWLARLDKDDVIDLFYDGVAWVTRGFYHALSYTQTGGVRLYAAAIALGAIFVAALVVFL
ncbi:MAG: NADH-quinone oxidoreductase subunit L [Anaerolineae bacterium]